MNFEELIKSQVSKISTFIYILVLLFGVNLIFNLNYQWAGISLIVKVYIFLLSFFIMYNFSTIDIIGLKSEYKRRYGRMGVYILFLGTRVFPVFIIYSSVIVYTLIEDINLPYWPLSSFMEIISGRNSNIVFVAIILLIILKLKKGPGITIPIFLGFAVLHFIAYKSVYRLLPLGIPITVIKLVELTAFLFFMIYEFNAEKKKIVKSLLISLVIGVFLYFNLIGVYSMIYAFSSRTSYSRILAARNLLKLGYSFPLAGLEDVIRTSGNVENIDALIFYSRKYGRDINFSAHTWRNIFLSSPLGTGENIIRYIKNRNIDLTFNRIVSYAEIKSIDDGESLIKSKNLISYASRYTHHYADLVVRYRQRNDYFKIWVMRVVSFPGNTQMVPFFIGELMGTSDLLVHEAYNSLKKITGQDPAAQKKIGENDSEVVVQFMRIYRQNSIPR
ncbi:MAG TPA: hypothetical protein PK573_11255 [Spirochaetota bacterium]|nr:hypothetical protein [Spirochaetota bacterium]HSA14816.1 hypothetical protein [Spirochaetota bacterium]